MNDNTTVYKGPKFGYLAYNDSGQYCKKRNIRVQISTRERKSYFFHVSQSSTLPRECSASSYPQFESRHPGSLFHTSYNQIENQHSGSLILQFFLYSLPKSFQVKGRHLFASNVQTNDPTYKYNISHFLPSSSLETKLGQRSHWLHRHWAHEVLCTARGFTTLL